MSDNNSSVSVFDQLKVISQEKFGLSGKPKQFADGFNKGFDEAVEVLLKAGKDNAFRISSTPNPDKTKPQIGLKPFKVHNFERLDEIECAIHRYEAAGKEVPIEWRIELEFILSRVNP